MMLEKVQLFLKLDQNQLQSYKPSNRKIYFFFLQRNLMLFEKIEKKCFH